MTITLKCQCQITEEGKFLVSSRCQNCTECNLVSKLHPFGTARI